MKISNLENYGINYQKGLDRCLSDPVFYERILSSFLSDNSFFRAKSAFNCNNLPSMFKCLHELKGASGNVGMVQLYDAVCPLVDFLRINKDTAKKEDVTEMFAKIEKAFLAAWNGVCYATDQQIDPEEIEKKLVGLV